MICLVRIALVLIFSLLSCCQSISGSADFSEEKSGFASNSWTEDSYQFQNGDEKQTQELFVRVSVPVDEVWVTIGKSVELLCSYALSTQEDRPVTVTWKVGEGPRLATSILKCIGYTTSSGSCAWLEMPDSHYNESRVKIGSLLPSLEISPVIGGDNRNYWCEVSVDGSSNYELGYDMKSIGLKLWDEPHTPYKLNHVIVDNPPEVTASVGTDLTINCKCNEESYYCQDVFWYKGPLYGNQFELIYSRMLLKTGEIISQAYDDWVGRATLIDNSLHLTNVQLEDAGRYWCEIKAADFYYQIEEFATDAESVILHVTNE